jgi:DNA-binding transcriptional ArsR family regulator
MDKAVARKTFESLASGLRLDIFCLLVRSGTEGRVAGEIAEALGLPATNLSFHLKAMLGSGLVTVQSQGRYQRYRANVPHMLRVLAFVMENCALAGAEEETCAAGVKRSRSARRSMPMPGLTR